MGGEIAGESWFGSLRWISWKGVSDSDKGVIEILAFEVATLMLKVVNLWHCLSEKEVDRLREEIVNLVGVRKLVSEEDDYLMGLALNEIVENLGSLLRSVARFGKRCRDPVYHRFEQFVNDPIHNRFQWVGWEYKRKKMERKVKKMERFVAAMFQMSQELEVLAELEQTLRRMQNTESNRVKVLEFQKKVMWQRQEVRNLREMSPWNRTYDYIVRLLIRSLLTMLERVKHVFVIYYVASAEGNTDHKLMNIEYVPRSHSFSALTHSSVQPFENKSCGFYSGPIERSVSKPGLIADKHRRKDKQQQDHHRSSSISGKHPQLETKRLPHVGPFKGCMIGGSDSPFLQSCKPTGGGSMRLSSVYVKSIDKTDNISMESLSCRDKIYSKLSLFSSKCKLSAPLSTLGDAALALHYANVIILIEKLASSPHLIGLDTRDDLYNMLPTNIRNALRVRLKSYAKTTASSVYDAALAAEWSLALMQILDWLAPLAHNMIRWHSERNFEKQHTVSQTNVLLVQTLHFANLAKTEATITELLVGLNYTCRIGRGIYEKDLSEPAGHGACNNPNFKGKDIAYDVF